MIEVTIRGVPDTSFTRPMPRDPDGAVRFTLDEAKHDPFEVLDRTLKLCGYVAPATDPRFDAMMAARVKAKLRR